MTYPPNGALTVNNRQLAQRDLKHLWHPCTQMKDHEYLPLIPIKSGTGVWLQDYDGNRYLDAISSWWVNLFGHSNAHINQRINEQLQQLEHCIFAGYTHQPAVELAESLVAITPPGLDRVFLADNGSSAVEVALKMSFHYWLNQGHGRKHRFINLSNSYHGETLGALAVGDVPLYKDTYAPLLMQPLTAPSPDCFGLPDEAACEANVKEKLLAMQTLLETHHEEVCAVIVEPLVQCAGGMRMYPPSYLSGLRDLCDHYRVHLIADEIAVGFGRTGTFFACEQAAVSPDFMCLSKGLTGGYLALSAVLTSEAVYQAFYDDYTKLTAFLHSHSYTGNPLACTAALATLELFELNDTLANNQRLAGHLSGALAKYRDHPNVAEIRQTGLIAAVELQDDRGHPFDWKERRGLRVYRHGLKNRLLIRPLGDVVYFMPPYVITPDEIDFMVDTAFEGINEAVQ